MAERLTAGLGQGQILPSGNVQSSEDGGDLELPMLAPRGTLLPVVSWNQDKNPLDSLAEICSEVSNIPRDEMGCFSFDCGKQDRNILIRQTNPVRKFSRGCVEQMNASGQPCQPASLNFIGKVDPRFF